MSIFKCKMCGGTIEFEPGATVGVCDSCGTRQTLPRLDDDRRANLYDRANHFRRNNEFDKAAGIYEQILNEDSTDAEAYWSLVLCRYGIEYVEDPQTRRRVPTVNRAQFTSVFDDDNYRSALQYADPSQKALYFEEAQAINEIQKGILQISQKEDPFDIFICYKETDAAGRRTPDSVLANDLYHQLTQEGFKVFFSRITLESKLGSAYEPYIFAALNSAKVMVVLGTRPEYFNAVWVKNEWARYLALIRNGADKVLIPAYKDMDPYDLPDEFSHLQALDMSKLGFMQDLIRGIKKISGKDQPRPVYAQTGGGPAVSAGASSLLRRAFMFLEDGNWQEADQYCEKVLDMEPENARAYLGKLMAELQVRTEDALGELPQPFNERNNYRKAFRFGDQALRDRLTGYTGQIMARLENERMAGIYERAADCLNAASRSQSYSRFGEAAASFREAAGLFGSVSGFRDADMMAENCRRSAEICRQDAVYQEALQKARRMDGKSVPDLESAVRLFQQIPGWRDSYDQIGICMRKIGDLKTEQEAERLRREREAEAKRIAAEEAARKRKRNTAIAAVIIAVCFALAVFYVTVIAPQQKLDKAIALMNSGDYKGAYVLLKNLNYEGSSELLDTVVSVLYPSLYNAGLGDMVVFGSYEQDNNTSDGKEAVEWQVLARQENKLLLISRYALDCQPYSTRYDIDVTWEKSSIRAWLNGTFLKEVFSAEEQMLIPQVTVSAGRNPYYYTDPGKSTSDKIFLLSINEAKQYFASDEVRQAVPTAYAKAQGASTGSNGSTWWWLRSPGYYMNIAAIVKNDGDIDISGHSIRSSSGMVRPALWIDL